MSPAVDGPTFAQGTRGGGAHFLGDVSVPPRVPCLLTPFRARSTPAHIRGTSYAISDRHAVHWLHHRRTSRDEGVGQRAHSRNARERQLGVRGQRPGGDLLRPTPRRVPG